MDLDLELIEGAADLPVVVLVHGFGMNKAFWQHPQDCLVMGGAADLTVFLTDEPPEDASSLLSMGRVGREVKGLGERLREAGFSVASWSQRDELGPIETANSELAFVVDRVKRKWPARPVYLVCHSRGGLVAKSYLTRYNNGAIAGLVTIASPFAGTRLAGVAKYLQPLGKVLAALLPAQNRSVVGGVLHRVNSFLNSTATLELVPDSALIKSLQHPLPAALRTLSFGGTSADLLKFFVRPAKTKSWQAVSYSELLARVIPARSCHQGWLKARVTA
jgi:pimeloyl-ACP methyl ester carboxylesterase